MELHCPHDLALRLGAICPDSTAHHKALRDAGDGMVVRDQDGAAMFWPLLFEDRLAVARRSS